MHANINNRFKQIALLNNNDFITEEKVSLATGTTSTDWIYPKAKGIIHTNMQIQEKNLYFLGSNIKKRWANSLLRATDVCSNLLKSTGVCWVLLESAGFAGVCCGLLRSTEVYWNILGCTGIYWGFRRSFKI